MNVIIGKYKLEPTVTAENLFDVLKTNTLIADKRKKDVEEGEEYDKEKAVAYGVTLIGAVSLIIKWNLAEQKADVTLREYVVEYKREAEKVLKVLDGLTAIKI